ncbi:sulfatase-like hydrolase/transferase [Isosphaeraceae bacterium EP7]
MSNVRPTLAALMLLFAPIAASGRTPAADPRPNVVLIVADDLGWADLGCYGSTFHKTPNLDRLAASGRRFTQAYAASPVCSPTRAALLTGKHPARLGLTDWLPGRGNRPDQKRLSAPLPPGLPLEETTLAERFQAAGYATALIGKWHLGGPGLEPTRQGFDLNIAGDATGSPLSYVAPFTRNGRTMPGLAEAPAGQYLTDRLAIEAERFIEAHKSAPFFLYLPHYAVHTPMNAKADLVAKYPPWDGIPRGKQQNPTYAAMLESVDDAVGRVTATLDRLNLSDNTILVFTSDNGGLATREGPLTPATNNSPFREGKGWLYEGGLRVPLIIRQPGRIAPGTDPTPTWAADLVPTLLALSHLPDPGPLDGQNLAPLLTDNTPVAPRALHWHYPHYSNQGGRPGAAIREGDWKLIQSEHDGRTELFNLAKDPSENVNLALDNPDKVRALTDQLIAWKESVGARSTTPNPAHVPNPQAPDGSITLHASTAEVHGRMLRFEPLPHKETLGYWVKPDDWAHWDFTVDRPGTFDVLGLIGCGENCGGSLVEFRLDAQTLPLTVPVTGGFQNFKPMPLGQFTITNPGRHRIELRALSKPGPAVMDIRQLKLTPAKL